MVKKNKISSSSRDKLIDDFYRNFGSGGSRRQLLRFWWKVISWNAVVKSSYFIKRALDIVLSLLLLILLFPFILLIALVIKWFDGGDVLYISERIGKWGRPFPFPKFRTMVVDADKIKGKLFDQSDDVTQKRFKMKRDPRITPIGSFLRKSSLDELPQLYTVLVGDMSLVGPRPPLPEEVQHYTLEERRRLDIKPGITCFWQVLGRSSISFEEQVKLDLKYIESQSFFLDLKILLYTIPAILFGKGAY